jgi:amino acid transporter
MFKFVIDQLTPEHRIAGSKRLLVGMSILVAWGLIGFALIATTIIDSVGKTANNGFLSTGSIVFFALGLTFLVFAVIGFRAFSDKRKELLESSRSSHSNLHD